MSGGPDIRFRLVNWIGIIDQLATTKANQVLADLDLPMHRFVMLNHFSHRPDEPRTVSAVARAMQQNQPAVSKTANALVAAGLLRWAPNPEDGRSKLLHLTEAGRAAHWEAIQRLMPFLEGAFDGWTETELTDFFGYLDRLKQYLDRNR